MPRALRNEYPGAICHVMNRGDHRGPIFQDSAAGERVLQTSIKAVARSLGEFKNQPAPKLCNK